MSWVRRAGVLFSLALAALSLEAQTIIRCPNPEASLKERWDWAGSVAPKKLESKDYWVGYSIIRLMDEDSYISGGNMFSGGLRTRRSLYAMLENSDADSLKRSTSHESHGKYRIFKKLKDVAFLFRVSGDELGGESIQKILTTNMELSVDLKNSPLLWLGSAEDEQSVQHLKSLFSRLTTTKLKENLVQTVGIHQQSNAVFPFLVKLIKSDESDEIRAQAAFWIGEQNQQEGLGLLVETAQKDRSLKVREQAVFAISLMDSDESVESLISLARKPGDTKVRSKAAFWLGNKASQKVVAVLENIVADDIETDVQRQALFALARNQDREGVDRLIKIAKTHPNPHIRKQAVQCLGQSEDSRALEALIEIVRK
jgi:hypothetical protein